MALASVEGAAVTTVEGLGTPDELSPVQAAFHDRYAAQCGYCTSGFLMATQALVERGESMSREQVIESLTGHVCRCTGYVKIIEAATAAVNGDVEPREAEVDMGPGSEEDVRLIPGSPA
jgi:aerobic-type carbon monoxide dehydrogenase small subunit (CoxS/CutS family)